MKLSKFSELVARIWSNPLTQRRDPEITIVVHSPGSIGATPSVEVESIQTGFDWDAGQALIYPAQPLTTLTPEQVADITSSVRKGQSWHAFETYKKHKAQLENAAIEYAKVSGQRDELLAALVFSREVFHQMSMQARTRGDRQYFTNLLVEGNTIDAAIASAKGGAA